MLLTTRKFEVVFSEDVFSKLVELLYENADTDVTLIGGDFNARTGNLADIIEDIDEIPKRNNPDNKINVMGEELIDMIRDCNLTIINGRVGTQNDFTCFRENGA